MRKLELFLSRHEGDPPDALDKALEEEADRLREHLPEAAAIRVAHSLEHHRDGAAQAGDDLPRLDELIRSGLPPAHSRVPVTSFDAAVEIGVDDDMDLDRLLAAASGLVGRLGPAVDPARSAAVLGIEHVIIEGEGPLELFYCLRRVPSLTHEQFSSFWRNELVRHTSKTPRKSAYSQMHADPELTVRAAKAVGVAIDDVDGVALEWYPDLQSMWVAIDWANEPRAQVIEAETQMSDFSRAMAMLSYSPQT